MREAMRLLLSENLLTQLPTGGLVVPKLNKKEIEELYDVRSALEGMAAHLAALKRSEDDIASMRTILQQNEALVSFPEDAHATGSALHNLIVDVADNSWLKMLRDQISSHIFRYQSVTNKTTDRRSKALEDHRRILEAIVSGDAEESCRLAELHVADAKEEAIRAIATYFEN